MLEALIAGVSDAEALAEPARGLTGQPACPAPASTVASSPTIGGVAASFARSDRLLARGSRSAFDRDRRAVEAVRRADRTSDANPGRGTHRGRDHRGCDRRGHDALSFRQALGFVGRIGSWQQAERWQTSESLDHEGNRHLRAVLSEVAWVISHTKDNYLSAQYHRFVRRIGTKRAIVATSHSVLTIVYHLLRTGQIYHDLGPHHFQALDTTRQRQSAVRRLEALGYQVSLQEPIAVPSPSSSSVPRDGPSSPGTLDVKKEVPA